MIFPLQEIRDLLPAAVVLANQRFPHQPHDPRWNLARPSGALLGLGMAIEKARGMAGGFLSRSGTNTRHRVARTDVRGSIMAVDGIDEHQDQTDRRSSKGRHETFLLR